MFYNIKNQTISQECPLNGYLEDGTLVQGLNIADSSTQKLCGIFPIKSDIPPAPANSTEDISQRVVSVQEDGVEIVRTWIQNPPIVPESVSARQIRLWLINNQIPLASVENAINSIENTLLRETTKIEWEFAPYVERNHPMVDTLGVVLGLTDEQIDSAFIQASTL